MKRSHFVPIDALTGESVPRITPASATLSSKEHDWEGILVERISPPPIAYEDCPEWLFPAYSLAIHLGPSQEITWGTDRKRRQVVHMGEVNLFSAGEPRRAGMPAGYEVLAVSLEPALVARAAEDRGPCEIVGGLGVRDPQVEHLGMAFLAELGAGCLSGRLFGEGLAAALAAHLLARYAVHPVKLTDYRRGLGKSDLARVLSFIGDRLAADLSLGELAACCHLSPYHFCRLFKQSTGQSPHQYVIAQRIERAKSLLRGGLTVGEVAQAVGFSEQGRLQRHFKRLVGITPGQFREGR